MLASDELFAWHDYLDLPARQSTFSREIYRHVDCQPYFKEPLQELAPAIPNQNTDVSYIPYLSKLHG